MRLLFTLVLLLIVPGLTSCYKPPVVQPPEVTKNTLKKRPVLLPEDIILIPQTYESMPAMVTIKDKVYSQYQEWKGIRYMRGGMSKSGVDCSGLTCIFYSKELGITLPRTARLQAETGKKIKRNELHPGDLVFFKTGRNSYHVGIYIENGKFLHVSTSSGVMISTLDDKYWKGHYWQSRRI